MKAMQQLHQKNIIEAGTPLSSNSKVLILLHGRGGSAEDILSLAAHLQVPDFTIMAPQASNHTWYPFSFMAPTQQNEPWLSDALRLLQDLTDELTGKGIASENIYLAGFSQGACLTLEFATRHARNWGGVAAFTGGLIGAEINTANYNGNFQGTPVFIGTSDPDPHVPVERVEASARILREMGASVQVKVYPNMGHTITQEEITIANQFVFSKANIA